MPRHNTPRGNEIINNSFFYDKYNGGNPAVYIGSRDGAHGIIPKPGYCDKDGAYRVGSGVSDLDFARDNVVMQNQVVKRRVRDMIKVRNAEHDSPNYIAHNETVSRVTERASGCFLETSFSRDFLEDGEQTEVAMRSGNRDRCVVQRCDDGDLKTVGACGMRTVPFECSVSGDNAGCRVAAACGTDEPLLAVSAACNLEHGTVSSGTVDGLEPGTLSVVRESDDVIQGECRVGTTSIDRRWSTSRGPANPTATIAACREHDSNGGDCHIRGVAYCRTSTGAPTIDLPRGKINPQHPPIQPRGPISPINKPIPRRPGKTPTKAFPR